MTEKRDSISNHWISERFARDVEGLSRRDHFYEDDDPRIRLTTDRWGDEVFIVGYCDPIKLVAPIRSTGETEICPWIIGIRVRDDCLAYYDPSSIDQAEYPVYVSQPFVHPDYSTLQKDKHSRQKFAISSSSKHSSHSKRK